MIAKKMLIAAVTAAALLTIQGCAVTRGQSTVGEFVDDTAITTAVKAKMAADKRVAATSIGVDTLNGTVMLSGFAKNNEEKSAAEEIARATKGVKMVKNEIAVRP